MQEKDNILSRFEEVFHAEQRPDDQERIDDLEEVLEIRLKENRYSRLSSDDLDDEDYTTVLTRRIHREPTTRTKRAQKMQAAYLRSTGMGKSTPGNTGYVKIDQPNGKRHWTIRR